MNRHHVIKRLENHALIALGAFAGSLFWAGFASWSLKWGKKGDTYAELLNGSRIIALYVSVSMLAVAVLLFGIVLFHQTKVLGEQESRERHPTARLVSSRDGSS